MSIAHCHTCKNSKTEIKSLYQDVIRKKKIYITEVKKLKSFVCHKGKQKKRDHTRLIDNFNTIKRKTHITNARKTDTDNSTNKNKYYATSSKSHNERLLLYYIRIYKNLGKLSLMIHFQMSNIPHH